MRFIKYIFILSFFLPAIVFSGESVDSCSVAFSKYQEFIKSFFSDSKNIGQYQGQIGYIRFVEEHLSFLKMSTVFDYTSKVLSTKDMDILNWQKYQGNTKEFKKERSNILDEIGNIKQEYQGSKGYIRYSDEFYGGERKELGDMQTTYKNVSAVLSESEKKNLNWKSYEGNTKEFREERSQILDETGNIKQEYQGLEGYIRYADEFYGGERKESGDMQKTYRNVSAVLSESEKKNLKWKTYQGNTKEFRKERSKVLDETGNIKQEYQGLKGHIRYADEFYNGKMLQTYINVSAVLSESEKKNLKWKTYQGNTKEFRKERSKILDETGNIKQEYQGLKGHIRYADEFYNGKMFKTYINVSAVLSELEKKSLNWQIYQGNTKEFREERSKILDETGNIKQEYQGSKGYIRYSDEFYAGKMQATHINVFAVLSESEKKSLNWQQYHGNTKKFRKERLNILDEKGNIKQKYREKEGYIRYSDEFYAGKMQITYINVSAVLSKEDMKDLGWKQFIGDTHQFRALLEFFKNHSFEDYKGPLGQKKIAKMIFKNHLRNTYKNISALRDHVFSHKDEFKDLRKSGWSQTLSW